MKLPSRKVFIIIAIIFTIGGFVNPLWFIVVALAIAGAIISKPKASEKAESPASAIPPEPVQAIPTPAPAKKTSSTDSKIERYYADLDDAQIKAFNNVCGKNPAYSKSKADIIEDGQTDERIYEYNYFEGPAELVPADGQRIDVSVQGKNIGSISPKECARVNALITDNKIRKVIVSMYGGKYKEVKEDYDAVSDNVSYELDRDETDRTVKVAIFLK